VYARVPTAEVQLGKIEEMVSVSRDSTLPAATQQQGYEGGRWHLQRGYKEAYNG
jgi:pimeloyl-ACP methyl ester carboxylesterase